MGEKIPIVLITGSLGSGKTTLMQHLIRTSGKRLAVLMNEFGEIAIDSRIIEGENIRIIELAGGCVCCELTGELASAVQELLETAVPDAIVLEATGVAESDAVVYEVEESIPQVRLESVVCLIDADVDTRYPQIGYVSRTQIEAADIILINKIDLVSESDIRRLEALVRRYNNTPAAFKTVRCQIDADLVFGPEWPGRNRGVHRSSPREIPHGSEFSSFTYETETALKEDAFRRFAEALPDNVLRAKGFVRTENGGRLFNYVAGRFELEPFATERTRLVFIGRSGKTDRDPIINRLKQLEA